MYYNSSKIPNDTTQSMDCYACYSSNYKNDASIYLCKINIEKKNFSSALKYLVLADSIYKIQFNCGTMKRIYNNELKQLYALCYEGLEKYNEIIDLLLPDYYKHGEGILTNAIKKCYTQDEIEKQLLLAIDSIIFSLDTIETTSITNYGSKDETVSLYYSGSATTVLFDRNIELDVPNLENGEKATKELFINEYRKSFFYKALTKK